MKDRDRRSGLLRLGLTIQSRIRQVSAESSGYRRRVVELLHLAAKRMTETELVDACWTPRQARPEVCGGCGLPDGHDGDRAFALLRRRKLEERQTSQHRERRLTMARSQIPWRIQVRRKNFRRKRFRLLRCAGLPVEGELPLQPGERRRVVKHLPLLLFSSRRDESVARRWRTISPRLPAD